LHRGAWAETFYDFIRYSADNGTHVLTKIEGAQHLCNDLTSKTNVQESTFTKEGGWWGVKGDVVHEGRIIVNKDTWLILSDGATLTAKKGIYIKDGATLTIYAQSEGDNMGRIIARTTENDKADIGGEKNTLAGKLIIHGGDIDAQAQKKYAAGIGGGFSSKYGGTIVIYNGTINISGGTIMAIGVNYSPSIGGGYKVLKSKINTTTVEGYASAGFLAVQGQTIAMSECDDVPDGCEFVGWLKQNTLPASIEAADNETLLQPGDDYLVAGNDVFFARYRYKFTETWTWNDDLSEATLRIKAGNNDAINVTNITLGDTRRVVAPTGFREGFITATATATYTSGNTTYTFTETNGKSLYYTYLLDEVDNTSTLSTYNSCTGNMQLMGRTVTKDGYWNTLCLPFELEDGDKTDGVTFSGTPLEGATVKQFSDASFNNGILTLNFTNATRIRAGRPYLVKWDNGTNLGPSDLVFNGIMLNNETNDETCDIDDETSITFKGTYKKIEYNTENRNVLYLGAGNRLYYPESGATIGA